MLRRNIFDCLPQRDLPGIVLYSEILGHSHASDRIVSQYFHGADIPGKKRKFISYGVLSVKNISDHLRVHVDFS